MTLKGKILIIDDNLDLLEYLQEFFIIYNYEVILAENGKTGIAKFEEYKPDIIITDMRLPDISGDKVVKEIKKKNRDVPIIVITGYSDQKMIINAMKNGAIDLLKKPFKPKDLHYLINKIESLFKKIKLKLSLDIFKWDKKYLQIGNDIGVIPYVIDSVLANSSYLFENDYFIRVGLQEILLNAIEHGNLNISYEEKHEVLENGNYKTFLTERMLNPLYKDKKVGIKIFSNNEYLKIIISDEGNGFDVNSIPNPNDPENLLGESGRGVLLAMNSFDEVNYNKKGNEVSLIKISEFIDNTEIKREENDSFEIYNKFKELEKIRDEYVFELDLAAEFQNTFLPKKASLDDLSGLKSDYIFIPLIKVSGDFIDISKLEDGMYGIFLSDIAGHGVAAALISSMLKVFFSLYAKDVLSPELLYNMLNSEFFQYLNSGEYFTSFYGIFFRDENKFVYTNANHPPPLLLRADSDDIIELNTEGFFIGIFENSEFEEKEVILNKGDRVLFYTDGIIEAKDANNNEFGLDRVIDIYKNNRKNNISDLIAKIKEDVFNYTYKIEDDITIAIFEVE